MKKQKRMIEVVVRRKPPKGTVSTLRKALKALLAHFGVGGHGLTVVLTDDTEIRQLKCAHFGVDEATDVLSFPSWKPTDTFIPPHLGDIVISLDTSARQAQDHGCSLVEELVLLVSHGMTHLMGHDHPHADGFDPSLAQGPEWDTFHESARVARLACG